MSHSKRNTSLAFFTSYERSLLKGDYGKQRSRLGRENFKAFDACNLCLLRAREPVACESHAHIFCRECAMENLLTQRKEIKRLQKELELRIKEDEEQRAREEEEAKQRAIRDFELLQMGLELRNSNKQTGPNVEQKIVGRENGKLIMEELVTEGEAGEKGKKRKFELDEEELLRIAREERQRKKIEITEEKKAASAAKLPSFWVPSLTPSVVNSEAPQKELKLKPVCPASDKNHIHYFALRTLVTVNFTEETADKNKHGEPQRSCPACKRVLNNASKAMLAKPCGHVICKPCVEKFMQLKDDPHDNSEKGVRCYVCDADLADKKKGSKKDNDKEKIRPGLVLIQSDGTGFTAGGGIVTTEKQGIAFQC
ncbi:hypothetical protein BDZ91DRAFT_772070 [Kalaharituber pfeilii]|nr:hypothetical protein BDZ91DRAFT_772070 [Kalaharituber pfeilii]